MTTYTAVDSGRKRHWGGPVALLAATLLVTLATLPPLMGEGGRTLLMHAFAPVCHQIPERSPHLYGTMLAVCHRCYGIYWGLLLGVMLYGALGRWSRQLERRVRYVIPLSLLPLGLDWLMDVLGIWTNTPLSRVLTGGLFGLLAGALLARALTRVSPPPREVPLPE